MAKYTIDPRTENLLSTSAIAARVAKLQGRDRPYHKNSVGHWLRIGVRGVRLPSVMVAGERMSSENAIFWWIQATTEAAAPAAGGSR